MRPAALHSSVELKRNFWSLFNCAGYKEPLNKCAFGASRIFCASKALIELDTIAGFKNNDSSSADANGTWLRLPP